MPACRGCFCWVKKCAPPARFDIVLFFIFCATRARPPRYNPFLYSSSFVVCFEFLLYW